MAFYELEMLRVCKKGMHAPNLRLGLLYLWLTAEVRQATGNLPLWLEAGLWYSASLAAQVRQFATCKHSEGAAERIGKKPGRHQSSWQHWCGQGSRRSYSAPDRAVVTATSCATEHPNLYNTCTVYSMVYTHFLEWLK